MFYRGIVNFSVSIILALQLIIIPCLGNVNHSGKLYLLIFFVLLSSFSFAFFIKKINISYVLVLLFILFGLFLTAAFQSAMPFWAFLTTFIFLVYLVYTMFFSHWAKNDNQLFDHFVVFFIVFGLVAALLGLYEFVHSSVLGPTETYLIPYLLPPDQTSRVVGFYGQPNLFALFLSVVLLAFFYRYLLFPREQSSSRFLYLRFLPPFLVAFVFFLTGSRAGFLSLVLILAFLSWLVASGRYLQARSTAKREYFYLLLSVIVAFLLYKTLPWLFVDANTARSFGSAGLGADVRYVFWMSAILIFLDHPWFGIGLDNYGFIQDAYGPLSRDVLRFVPYEAMGNSRWAHNEILQILAEGGVFAVGIILLLLWLFLSAIWKKIVKNKDPLNSQFLFCHLFLLPFIIQSMFSWPFRSPPLLLLFFTFLSLLLAQYPMKSVSIQAPVKWIICASCVLGLLVTIVMFKQELRIGKFKQEIAGSAALINTLPEMRQLSKKSYSNYRVLSKVLPLYTREALILNDSSFVEQILPLYEQLVEMEGSRWQWYDLARLYSKVGRENDARKAIEKAINLMPSDDLTWSFLHYLNMHKASRETGRPIDAFWPQGKEINFLDLELTRE